MRKNLSFILSTFLSVTAHNSAFSAGWEATSIWFGNCKPRFSCLVIPQESDTAQKHRRTVLRKKLLFSHRCFAAEKQNIRESWLQENATWFNCWRKKTYIKQILVRAIWKYSLLLHPTNNMKRTLQTCKQLPGSAVNIDWWKSLEKQGVI